MLLKISDIRIDGGTQVRAQINQEAVDDYARAIEDGAAMTEPVVFYDGSSYWLADGFHRYHAHGKAGRAEMQCQIKNGTQRDAILYATGANVKNGMRLTNADKRHAVQILLNDEEWSKWSDPKIAAKCGVSQPFVLNMRSSLITVISENDTDSESEDSEAPASPTKTYVNKHGQTSTMNTKNIGKNKRARSSTSVERDAGEDTIAPKDEGPKNGSVEFDWKEFESDYGRVVRQVTELGKFLGLKESPECHGLKRRLREWQDDCRDWYKQITKKDPPKELSERLKNQQKQGA